MKKSQVLFLMISIAAMTLIGRDVLDRYAFPDIARAQSIQPTQSGAQPKWEYCALQGTGSSQRHFGSQVNHTATIYYYQTSDWRKETVELDQGKEYDGERRVIAKAIAKLGEEGWEMIQDRTDEGTTSWIYFKRPKQ